MLDEFLIKCGNKTFEPSEYQKEILHFAKYGVGDAFIQACAGASKTTMLENILYHIPPDDKKLFIAFNKSISDEMKNRVKDIENVNITTYHSLGYAILRENLKKEFTIDEDKYKNFLRENITKLTSYEDIELNNKNYQTYINNIIHLIEYSRYYLKSHVIHINKIAEQYNLNLIRDEANVVKKMLEWGKNNTDIIDFTDMVWLVNEFNLTTKKYLYDIILIDEAQDTSIMQQEMITKCMKRGTRLFIVGDEYQSINVWCGSDINAVKKFQSDKCKIFTLPISYRCAKKIVELAQRYSPNIVASENSPEGEINYNVPITAPVNNDMVLCRNTAPLIECYLKYLKINKKCYIKGSENISERYIQLINETKSEYIDQSCTTCDGLIPKLYQKLNSYIDLLVSKGYTIDDAYHHSSVINLYDDIIGIITLSDNIINTKDLITKIKDIFKDRSNEGVMLTTVHKAKGLESENVYILSPSLLPNKYAKKEWEIKAEEHLTYVAYTRAKKTLNFMEENNKYTKLSTTFNFEKMIKIIEKLRVKIKNNSEKNITEKNVNLETLTPVNNCIEYENTKKIKEKIGNKFKNLF